MPDYGSKQIAKAAIQLSLTDDRTEETELRKALAEKGIRSVAIDFGSNIPDGIAKILEKAVVASRREGVIGETHEEEGAVIGATHEAIRQIVDKAIGLNIGGKIAIARHECHITVCVFFGIGLLNLNDISIGLGHRVI